MIKEKAQTKKSDWLKWLGERRDGFLVGGAVVYGLGYLVWSLNAWRNHLGQLPAFEFQYIISGLIPGILIAIAWLAIKFFRNMRDKIIIMNEKYHVTARIVLFVTGLIMLPLVSLLMVIPTLWSKNVLNYEQFFIYFFSIVLIIALMIYFLALEVSAFRKTFSQQTPGLPKIDKVSNIYRYLMTFFFCFFSLILYLFLYPRLPQELGGPQPRCAYIDLVGDEISPTSLADLVPYSSISNVPGAKINVVRSMKLNVYFSNNDYSLVRIYTDPNNSSGTDILKLPLYELRKDIIRDIQWCQ
jgi:hypothetical protein